MFVDKQQTKESGKRRGVLRVLDEASTRMRDGMARKNDCDREGAKERERRPVLRALAVWYGLGYFAAEALKEGGVAARTYPRHSNGSSIGRF